VRGQPLGDLMPERVGVGGSLARLARGCMQVTRGFCQVKRRRVKQCGTHFAQAHFREIV
jgi:hypothetical protein